MNTGKSKLTTAEIGRAFERILGHLPRRADLALFDGIGGVDEDELTHYIWDHWLGEPLEPTEDQVLEHVRAAVKEGA